MSILLHKNKMILVDIILDGIHVSKNIILGLLKINKFILRNIMKNILRIE